MSAGPRIIGRARDDVRACRVLFYPFPPPVVMIIKSLRIRASRSYLIIFPFFFFFFPSLFFYYIGFYFGGLFLLGDFFFTAERDAPFGRRRRLGTDPLTSWVNVAEDQEENDWRLRKVIDISLDLFFLEEDQIYILWDFLLAQTTQLRS